MLHLLLTALLIAESPKDVDSGPIREAKEGLQEDLFTKVLRNLESNSETLEELMSKNYAVLEGDMMLPSDRNAVSSTWPTLEIPYVISPELASRKNDILAAMAMVSEHTCVSFHNRTSETNYLLFKTSKGCASFVGFVGGEQPVFVGPLCRVGNIVHEILHALGFHHEHTRPDREQYITILPRNIMPGMERNFEMQHGKTYNLSYDISSIMHYGSGFFSANGQPTIIPNKNVKDMGQRVKMTKTDIARVRLLYSCDITQEIQQDGSADADQKDADMHVLVKYLLSAIKNMYQGQVSANKSEEQQTSLTASQSASLQLLTAATRGHNATTGGEQA
ncbi:astacin-like metalloendopeptidase [Siniperca chuatsi]|uniref:astacin-like metalloendopeptidase n=1 Tax=Siniperca chuatsi TaxID=119488 RepID=UPI001CE1D4B9|nr:astacin-like metalloendopeptidase [Siniperca chuatsi]